MLQLSKPKKHLNWTAIISITLVHILSLLAPFYFSWSGFFVFLFLYWLTGCIGITLCFHRLLTHRSFKTPLWLEYSMIVIGALALQGPPSQWVGDHRMHHKNSDHDQDPHTPNHGFNWAHIFWLFFENKSNLFAARDLMKNPFHRFLNRWFWIFQLPLIGLLYYLGGFSWVVWGVGVRTAFVYHITWFINSASHTWGYQTYRTDDRSTNLWWLALISVGEGWHNNHHACQTSAKHGFTWWEFDMTYWIIQLLALLGLAWDIRMPKEHEMTKK